MSDKFNKIYDQSINNPEKLQKEIHTMQRKLLSFHLYCEDNEDDILERMSYDDRPRSEATKWMIRAHDNILKDLFDMQDDFDWICKSTFLFLVQYPAINRNNHSFRKRLALVF